jgi:A/G-specific adenine glycosylase
MNFAYHVDTPVLDTNVARVLRRHFGVAAASRARPAALWSLAAAIIPPGRGYLINQALMDIGAMVCRARGPRCATCPLARSCAFRRSARQRRR